MADGTVVLPPRDRYAGLGQGFSNLVAGWNQQRQQQQAAQQLGQLFPNLNLQGITDPRMQMIAAQLGLQQQGRVAQPGFTLGPGQQRFGAGGQPIAQVPAAPPTPLTPTQRIAQAQLDRINLLQEKARRKTITKPEEAELSRSLQRNRPLVEFGVLPGLTQLLTPEQRREQAQQVLKKPLNSTEIKGVDTIVKAILGEPRPMPFGIRGGAAISQSKIETLWEQMMLETGYSGRSKIAQKQIESRFDRRIKELNRGKGLGVLANQYQWDRKKWEAKQNLRRKSNESIDDFIKRTGL